jgi:bifunctional non-homologous end joining protein LigD
MSLRLYGKKRDFKKTSEPKALQKASRRSRAPVHLSGARLSARPLQFVVQKHRARQLHYDFRLEWDGVLKSWAVPKGPPRAKGGRRLAVRVEDHPYAYKNFHGRIPQGQYGAGTVEIWDKGTYEPVFPIAAGLKKGHVTFILHGKKLQGEYALIKFRGPKNWLLIKAKKNL